MNIQPLTNKVLIEKEYFTNFGEGFVVPDEVIPESQFGTVVAVGDRITIPIKPGDKVYFPKYVGLNFTLEGKKYFMIEDAYVIAAN